MNLRAVIRKFTCLSLIEKLRIIFYPIFQLWEIPTAWMKSLWAARILLNGKWSRYIGFHPQNAINNFFYRTQWINLDRYGLDQVSPVIGLGAYPLRNWFHLALPASYIYAHAGAVTTLAGTFMWVFSHLIWIDTVELWWGIVVTLLLFFSSTSYAMAFVRQNYQILGWMWFPMALYAISEGNLVLAAFAWFAAGLAGITPIFFALPILIVMAVTAGDQQIMWTLGPALILIGARILPLLRSGGLLESLLNLAKMIGATSNKVRYHREMNRLGIFTIYFLLHYLLAASLLSIAIGSVAVLPFVGVFLLFVNERLVRVADPQSLIMLVVTLFVFEAVQSDPGWGVALALWFAVSPLGIFLFIQRVSQANRLGSILVTRPFDHTELEQGVETFLAEVNLGERVYFAFNDPGGKYNNIFDGYRRIHELPLQVASKKGIHLFPDWWAVAETNYEGAPQCWGRTPDEVKGNCERWGANYAIVYQQMGSILDPIWMKDFELLSEFDWGDYFASPPDLELWWASNPTPKWFLLHYNNMTITETT